MSSLHLSTLFGKPDGKSDERDYFRFLNEITGHVGTTPVIGPAFEELEAKARELVLASVGSMTQTVGHYTHSGQRIHYLNPADIKLTKNDVLNGLRAAKRFGGVVNVSVYEHTILCYRLSLSHGPEVARHVAAHDFHEAYLSDWPSPLKQVCPILRHVEALWEEWLHGELKLNYDSSIMAKLQEIDRLAMCIEVVLGCHPACNTILHDCMMGEAEVRWYAEQLSITAGQKRNLDFNYAIDDSWNQIAKLFDWPNP